MDKKQDSVTCCLQKIHISFKHTHRLRVRGWKKIFHSSGSRKRAGIAILVSDKISFKPKIVTRDKEVHYIMTKQISSRRYDNCKYICT